MNKRKPVRTVSSLLVVFVCLFTGTLLITNPASAETNYRRYSDDYVWYFDGGEKVEIPYNPEKPGDVKWIQPTGAHNNHVTVPESGDHLYLSLGFDESKLLKYIPPETTDWSFDMNGSPPTDNIATNNDAPTITPSGLILQDGGADRTLYAVTENGEEAWTFETNGRISRSPAVGKNGRVYVTNKVGEVFALNSYSGAKIWGNEFTEDGERGVLNSPVVDTEGIVYVSSRYPHDIGYKYKKEAKKSKQGSKDPTEAYDPALISYLKGFDNLIDPMINELKDYGYTEEEIRGAWEAIQTEQNQSSETDLHGGYTRHSGVLYAVNPDGSIKWKYSALGRFSPPAIAEDGTIIVASRNGFVHALNPDGTLRWKISPTKLRLKTRRTSPVIAADGTIYVGSFRKLFALTQSGKMKWHYSYGEDPLNAPSQFMTMGIVIGSDGTVHVTTKSPANDSFSTPNGKLFALTPDGKLKWSKYFMTSLGFRPNIADTTVIFSLDDYLGTKVAGVQISSQSMADAQWPSFQRGPQNRGSRGPFCTLSPTTKIRPKRINTNSGMMTLFITGFEDSKRPLSSIDPSAIRLAGAKPVQWKQTPRFLQFKFRRNKLNLQSQEKDKKRKKWTKTDLPINGTLKSSGCFSVQKEVVVRP